MFNTDGIPVEETLVEKDDFILTGSSVYGPYRLNRDIDIVVTPDELEEIWTFLDRKKIKTYQTEEQKKHDYSGFYFDIVGLTINLIPALPEEFKGWKKATETLKKKQPIEDRDARISLFTSIKEANI